MLLEDHLLLLLSLGQEDFPSPHSCWWSYCLGSYCIPKKMMEPYSVVIRENNLMFFRNRSTHIIICPWMLSVWSFLCHGANYDERRQMINVVGCRIETGGIWWLLCCGCATVQCTVCIARTGFLVGLSMWGQRVPSIPETLTDPW
jgi:hypothetical protein